LDTAAHRFSCLLNTELHSPSQKYLGKAFISSIAVILAGESEFSAFIGSDEYNQIFSGVDWEDLLFDRATTDSEQGTARDRHNARAMEIKANNMKASESIAVECIGRNIQHDRWRRQWELIISMYSARFGWNYQTDEQARRRDDLKHAGRTDYSQASSNLDLWPQTSMAALLKIWEFTEHVGYMEKEQMHWLDELSNPWKVGRLIANIVATDLFPVRWSVCSYIHIA
jgi:hypothetical protein